MFFNNKLQHYAVVNDVFSLFTATSSIIPFADLHHYKLAAKSITDPRFKSFLQKLESHMTEKMAGDNVEHVQSDFVNDEEILEFQGNSTGSN
jgi:hypothetical protein